MMHNRVLIVEDEIFVALEIEHIVEDAGFQVQAIAADRSTALANAAECDIALVDLNLRDGPTGPSIGIDLANRFGVRVIYITANPAQIGPASSVALGVITKPFQAQSIIGALHLASAPEPSPHAHDIAGFMPFSRSRDSSNGMESTS